jgi:hypothetical protein
MYILIDYRLILTKDRPNLSWEWAGPSGTVLARTSSNSKLQTHPLVREGCYKITNPQLPKENLKEKEKLVAGPRRALHRRSSKHFEESGPTNTDAPSTGSNAAEEAVLGTECTSKHPCILDLSTKLSRVVNFTPDHFAPLPRETTPVSPGKEVGWVQELAWLTGRGEKSRP